MRVLRDRDPARHLEHQFLAAGDLQLFDIARRREIARQLIHLHAGEVGMLDHDLGLIDPRLRLTGCRLDLHPADAFERCLGILAGRRRATTRRLDELRRHVELSILGFGHDTHVGVAVEPHPRRQFAFLIARRRPERKGGHHRRGVLIDDQRQLCHSPGDAGWNGDRQRHERCVFGTHGRFQQHRAILFPNGCRSEDFLAQVGPDRGLLGKSRQSHETHCSNHGCRERAQFVHEKTSRMGSAASQCYRLLI